MDKVTYCILQSGQLENTQYTLFRLHNSYKQLVGKRDYRALEVNELPDIKRITNIYDITAVGAIKKAEMHMLRLLSTYEFEKFNTAFRNSALIIDFVNVSNADIIIDVQKYSNWTIAMSAFNPQTNESVVIETLLIKGDLSEEK